MAEIKLLKLLTLMDVDIHLTAEVVGQISAILVRYVILMEQYEMNWLG